MAIVWLQLITGQFHFLLGQPAAAAPLHPTTCACAVPGSSLGSSRAPCEGRGTVNWLDIIFHFLLVYHLLREHHHCGYLVCVAFNGYAAPGLGAHCAGPVPGVSLLPRGAPEPHTFPSRQKDE